MLFAGKELSQKINYLKNQGKELDLNIKYPRSLEFFVRLYIALFGIPEIGFQERFNFFQRCVKDLHGKIFIDAGCGNGTYSRFMANLYPQSKIMAFDLEKKVITIAKELTDQKRINFFIHDLTKKNTLLLNKADIVWSLDVLEHIIDYTKAVKNLKLMVKKNGYLIIHVPLINQKRWFNYFKNWSHETHEREGFKKKEILNLLKNFEIIKEINTFGTLGSFIWEINTILFKKLPFLAIILFPVLRLIMFFDKIIPSNKYNCLGIIAKKYDSMIK
jgi:2-polyprenyl-3-methyl-5-hydroxy-6-metoxy-1,4-benzoquinol methylase